MWRIFISFCLLTALMLPLCSTALVFAHKKHRIRSEIKRQLREGMAEEELVLLRIPLSLEENPDRSFTRMHAGEFRYQGFMYDIVRQELRGDTTWYWCVLDWDDTELHNQLDEKRAQRPAQDPAHRDAGERLNRFWQTLFFATPHAVANAIAQAPPTPYFEYALLLCPGFFNLLYPPPEA